MQKETLVTLLGFVLILLPYLGIPDEWKRFLVVAFGVTLLVAGYTLMRDKIFAQSDLGNGERGTDTYVETTESLFKD